MSVLTEVTYEHLVIKPFDLVFIDEIKIIKSINNHGSLSVTALVPEEVKDSYIDIIRPDTVVQLINTKNGEKTLFYGMIETASIKASGRQYKLKMNCVTLTRIMDISLRNRSFQNINDSYEKLVKSIVHEYTSGDVIFNCKDVITNEFITQYHETDWQFIKRMASRFNQGLYPSFDDLGSKFMLGVPNIDNNISITEEMFVVNKKIGEYLDMSSNFIGQVNSLDFIEYEIVSYHLFELGEKIRYKDFDFYIKSAIIELVDGVLKNTYKICSKNGLKQPLFNNKELQGLSLMGAILDIDRDRVKVHIYEVDEKQNIETAYWFPYQAMYASKDGSGWYCMPEKGDSVLVKFINDKDKDAIVASSVSQYESSDPDPSKDRMCNYQHRFIRNPEEMEVILTPNSVIVSSKQLGIIELRDSGEIVVSSKNKIDIHAAEDIVIKSDTNVLIQAKDKIEIGVGEDISSAVNKITINEPTGKIEIKGKEVITN